MPLRYGQRRGLSFAWCARRDMGLETDSVAVAEAVGRRLTRPWSVVSCPLFVDGRRGNGLDPAFGGIQSVAFQRGKRERETRMGDDLFLSRSPANPNVYAPV